MSHNPLFTSSFIVSGGATQNSNDFFWPSTPFSIGVVANGSSGAFAATVKVVGSVDGTNFDPAAITTFTMAGTATTAEIKNEIIGNAPYLKGRIDLTSFTGTGATCDVTLSV